MKKLILIPVILLVACSPQKRLGNLLKNHPELSDSFTRVITDTVWTPEITYDTVFNVINETDTFVADNDTVKVTIVKTKTELKTRIQVRSYAVIERDTVKVTILKPQIVNRRPGLIWFTKWVFLPWSILFILLIIKLLRR